MRNYTDEEILAMFPGPNGHPVADIVPVTRIRRNRIEGRDPNEEVANVKGIEFKYHRALGVSVLDGKMQYEKVVYDIGPFAPGVRIRTDNIPNLSKEVPAFEILRGLLNHDGGEDEFGNLKGFYLEAVDPELLALEAEQKRDPSVRAQLAKIPRKEGERFAAPKVDDATRARGVANNDPGDEDDGTRIRKGVAKKVANRSPVSTRAQSDARAQPKSAPRREGVGASRIGAPHSGSQRVATEAIAPAPVLADGEDDDLI